jgi:hypothetical protein
MYQLYYSDDPYEIKITKLEEVYQEKRILEKLKSAPNKIFEYDDNLFFSCDRAELLELGVNIKQEWIDDVQAELRSINNITIK